MAKRHHGGHGSPMHGSYEGLDERRRMEQQDGSMLNEAHGSVANMPQEVKYHLWPNTNDYIISDGDLDDTIRGVDKQRGMDASQARKHKHPKKV
jgi:hypothetical protein